MNLTLSFYHDTRRAKANGLYPLKLNVFQTHPRLQKRFVTDYDLSTEEYRDIFIDKTNTNRIKQLRRELEDLLFDANQLRKESKGVFSQFESLYKARILNKTARPNDQLIASAYSRIIEKHLKQKRYSTANTYENSLKAINQYCELYSNKNVNKLTFVEINQDWLEEFEEFILNGWIEEENIIVKPRTTNTLGIYLRCLRASFNDALKLSIIEKNTYPFTKEKYVIPSTKGINKALTKGQLKEILKSNPSSPLQREAKELWLFSFCCNGMNLKDIAKCRVSQFDPVRKTLVFQRSKTTRTIRKNKRKTIVYLNDFALQIINKRCLSKSPHNLIFDIIVETDEEQQIGKKVKIKNRFINQHFQKLCQDLGIQDKPSFNWARHTHVSINIQNGASLLQMMENLGHTDISTTEEYWSGFDESVKSEYANQLMSNL